MRLGVRKNVVWTAVNMLALLGIVAASSVSDGSSRQWRHAEELLLLSTGAALVATGTELIMLLRSRRVWLRPVQRGVRRAKPVWMILGEDAPVVSIGAVLGAIISFVGLPTIGFCMLIAAGAFFAFASCTELVFRDDITFESTGLRVRNRYGGFLIPWNAIDRVEKVGSGLYQRVHVHIAQPSLVVDSIEPNTTAARAFVAARVFGADDKALVKLSPWIGGLDAGSLARAIQQDVQNSR